MTKVDLPSDLAAWAEDEVAAGRASSVEQVAARALHSYRHAVEEFRASLDAAVQEANEKGWLTEEEVFGPIEAELEARIAEEERANARSA